MPFALVRSSSSISFFRKRAVLLPVAAVFAGLAAHAQTDVLTWHNDNLRTGQDLSESILTPANVNSSTFGVLANVAVDGKVDAQPLYVSALNINGKNHNVLFVATEHDSVYALDADTGATLWQKSLIPSGETTSDPRNCDQVTPEIGITATPAIDRTIGSNGTIYLVAMTKNGSGNYYQRIHALNLATGAEEFGGPTTVQASVPGTGAGSNAERVTFDPKQYKERPGLLLNNGQLYTSWGSHCDIAPYAGWVMTYSPTTLGQTGVLDFVPNGSDAAPWNAGAGPAADPQGNAYLSLGNGTFDTNLNPQGFPSMSDYGNALVKVGRTSNGLAVTDYWTMYNSNSESGVDSDLGSGGLMLLPDLKDASGTTRQLIVAAGKDHNIYVADRNNMGHFNPNNNSTLYQELPGALPGGSWSSPAYFNGRVYYGSVGQNLRSFSVNQAKLVQTPIQTTATTFGYPGTTPSVSAFNNTDGIVWATENSSPAVLHAYDAADLSKELYSSSGASTTLGAGNKFIAPTIANGKVYFGTQNSVAIFGLTRQTPAPLPDGDYSLTNGSSHLLLDDPGAGSTVGIALNQWGANGTNAQIWFFSYNGAGYYTIQNYASKLFLDDANGATTPGTSATQGLPTHNGTELWSITAVNGGYVIKNKATGLLLDDSNFNQTEGQHVILWPANGGVNQTWAIK